MTQPVIPPPPNPFKLFDGTTHVIQGIQIDGAYVVLYYDELVARFSIDRNVQFTSSISLTEVMKTGGIAGRMVLEMSVDCGGTIADDYTKAPGTQEDFELVRQAIPYFYPCLFEPQSRKVMRAVYRRVKKLSSQVAA